MTYLMASPMEQFAVRVYVPTPRFLPGDMSLTNRSFAMLLSLRLFSVLFFPTGVRNRLLQKSRRGRGQEGSYARNTNRLVDSRGERRLGILQEAVVGTLRSQLGKGGVEQVLTPMTVLFVVLLRWNRGGLIPMRFTPTRHLRVNRALRRGAFLGMNLYGRAKHKGSLLSLLFPGDRPLWLSPLLVALETVSYLFRPISLSVRLFANMAAGHRLMHILGGFVEKLRFHPDRVFKLLSLLPRRVVLAVILLECGVRRLQRYVFLVLLSIYFRDVRDLHLGRSGPSSRVWRGFVKPRQERKEPEGRVFPPKKGPMARSQGLWPEKRPNTKKKPFVGGLASSLG